MLRSFLLICSLMILSGSIYPQFIKLHGKKFKSGNGHDYYPMVCTYSFDIAYNVDSVMYLTPINGYGKGVVSPNNPTLPNLDFECDDQTTCLSQIHNDFQKIREMGFNTIRTHGVGPVKQDTLGLGNIGFFQKAKMNIHPLWEPDTIAIPFNPPYQNDANTLMLFSWIDLILQEAGSCGLKVLLDAGYGDISKSLSGVGDYASYLSVLANHLKNDTNLMAYVVIEEPLYSKQSDGKSKGFICQITQMWYDAIRSVDTNHLITMGGSGYNDIFEWDPGVMKLDFYSPHVYPHNILAYENFNQDYAFDRVKGHLLWTESTCPLAWMIGETGFSAIDDFNGIYQLQQPPDSDGDFPQQASYAQKSLDAVRDCGGSGYSWWNYQENWWNDIREDGFGLLKHGEVSDPGIEKPVVEVFRNYPCPPPDPVSCSYPDNYYQPFDYYSGQYFPFTGYVKDQNGDPVKDAIIFGWNNWNHTPADTFLIKGISDYLGYFKISIPIDNPEDYFDYIKISAIGASIYRFSLKFPYTGGLVYPISRNYSDFDVEIKNQIIPINVHDEYFGYRSLSAYDFTIEGNGSNGGSLFLSSRNTINIDQEFAAEVGSYVHIFISDVFPTCGNVPLKSISYTPWRENLKMNPAIELSFIPSESVFLIWPNPCNDYVSVNKICTDEEQSLKTDICLYNLIGGLVWSSRIQNFPVDIKISDLSPGIYFISINDSENLEIKKIVIQ